MSSKLPRETATVAPLRRGLLAVDAARSVKAGGHLELLLIWAVAAILAIRLYLALTGYPRLGGGTLHIAHMLWGGLLMLAANVLLLSFLGARVKRAAAAAAGVGFGTFIDELGKFITADNDYFYEPTVGLIYVVFILLFLAFRQIERRRALSPEEYLVNAADQIKEVILGGAEADEIGRALGLLERSGRPGPVGDAIRQAVLSAARAAPAAPSIPSRVTAAARGAYGRLVGWRWFQRGVVLVFALDAIGTVAVAGLALLGLGPAAVGVLDKRSFVGLGVLLGSAASNGLALLGIARLARSRTAAYGWFRRSVLVSIFFVQVFLFFEAQLEALGGLAFDLLLLSGLNAMLHAERAAPRSGPAGRRAEGQGAGRIPTGENRRPPIQPPAR